MTEEVEAKEEAEALGFGFVGVALEPGFVVGGREAVGDGDTGEFHRSLTRR